MKRSPLLHWGLFFLLGIAMALVFHWAYLIPLLAFFLLCTKKWQALALFVLGFAYAFLTISPVGDKPIYGTGTFTLKSIAPSQSPFARSIALKGVFDRFEADTIYKRVPCMIFASKLPKTGKQWQLTGTLENGIFKPDKNVTWLELKDTFSFARWRYNAKSHMRS